MVAYLLSLFEKKLGSHEIDGLCAEVTNYPFKEVFGVKHLGHTL